MKMQFFNAQGAPPTTYKKDAGDTPERLWRLDYDYVGGNSLGSSSEDFPKKVHALRSFLDEVLDAGTPLDVAAGDMITLDVYGVVTLKQRDGSVTLQELNGDASENDRYANGSPTHRALERRLAGQPMDVIVTIQRYL